MTHADEGRTLLARDSTDGPWETTQLGGSPNKIEQKIETRIVHGTWKTKDRTAVRWKMIKQVACSEHWPPPNQITLIQ